MFKVTKNLEGDTVIIIKKNNTKEVKDLRSDEKIAAMEELIKIMSREEIRRVFVHMTCHNLKNLATNLHGEIYARMLGTII